MPPSSTLFAVQRFNWMGYHGTESKQLTVLDTQNSNLDYRYRQKVIAGIKERLYRVKRDLSLIPPEQLQAEEEARQRIRAAREQREREAAERERERTTQEEEERRAQSAAEAARGASVDGGHTARRLEAERSTLLERMPRQQAEIDYAVRHFTVGARALILSRDAGYVSHIDASVHTSVGKLDAYNTAHSGTGAAHDTQALRDAVGKRDEAHRKLDARRAQEDPPYAVRLRSSAKDSSGRPTTVVHLSENEEVLLNRLEQSKRYCDFVRKQYNSDAAAARSQVSL